MELQQISKTLQNKIEKAYVHDLEFIINTIYNNYDIKCRHTQTLISKDELLRQFIWKRCQALTKTGTICTKKPIDGFDYCVNHAQKQQPVKETKSIHVVCKQHKEQMEKTNFQLIQVDNSFYYLDTNNHMIYDKDNKTKVGYMDSDNTYIITDDPFVLEQVEIDLKKY